MTSRRPSRRIVQIAMATVLAVILALPATAITNGVSDGEDHPFVGSIVIELPDGRLFQFCSGTLISPTVFLTASHCTAALDGIVADFGALVKVTFEPTISAGGTFYTGEWVTNPNYNGFQGKGGASDPGDIAVIILDVSVSGITPASLPIEGLLDDLKAGGELKDTRFTAVGYGSVRDSNHGGWQGIDADNLARNRADQGFHSLTKAWLNLPMTPSNGNGGTCFGDSGGPHFIHLDGLETDIVVSLTVTGDAQCKALDRTYRTDTVAARDFLDDYVELP